MTRVAVVQPYVPGYRVPFFTRLRDELHGQGIEILVAHGAIPDPQSAREDAVQLPDGIALPTRRARLFGRELTYRNLEPIGHADLLILEQALGNAEGYGPLLGSRRRWPRVALWGHGRTYTHVVGPIPRKLKSALTNRADWFFAYTPGGAKHLIAHGFPEDRVTVVNNSVDTGAITVARRTLNEEVVTRFLHEHQLTGTRPIAFIGALDPSKRIDFLLASLNVVRREIPDVVLVVAGDGPSRGAVEGAGEGVRYVGRAGPVEKAVIAQIAPLIVCPGRVGLLAVDSFAMATPIVTTNWPYHAPEFEYLDHGRTAWITHDDATEFGRAVVRLLEDGDRLQGLQDRCRAALSSHSLDSMVDHFAEGVRGALGT